MRHPANHILKKHWGFDAFRALQAEIIESILSGQNTLALLPTGGGKSICYQVPALCFESGLTLVISPLIALIKDQVNSLKQRNVKAAAIYSGMHPREIDNVLENAMTGYYRLLYLSPERLKSELFLARLPQMPINFIAIDEAHCVSQWGHDFRPAYLQIADIKEVFPEVPFLALTATATPRVQTDIVTHLQLNEYQLFQKSYLRSNLSYSVLYEDNKSQKMLDILGKVGGTGIVYVRSRKRTQEIAFFLQKNGVSADFYHAGLSGKMRDQKQADWMQNRTRIMVCTNAFGMGIDKSDVRLVIHIELPESMEAYFQEAGRAGRDGGRSYAVLLHQNVDSQKLLQQHERSFPRLETIHHIYLSLVNFCRLAIGDGKGRSFDYDLQEHAQKYQLKAVQVHRVLSILQAEGYIFLSDAFFEPSRIRFSVSRTSLYDFQLQRKQHHPLIQTLLRTFGGILFDYITFSEQQVAAQLHRPVQAIKDELLMLNELKILNYKPQSDRPRITFLMERMPPKQLQIRQKNLDIRAKIKKDNIEAMIHYAETKNACRSQLLLLYFGEKESPTCGICDVCTGRNGQHISAAFYESMAKRIAAVLIEKEHLPLNELLHFFQKTPKEKLLLLVQQLIDDGKLSVDTERIVRWLG